MLKYYKKWCLWSSSYRCPFQKRSRENFGVKFSGSHWIGALKYYVPTETFCKLARWNAEHQKISDTISLSSSAPPVLSAEGAPLSLAPSLSLLLLAPSFHYNFGTSSPRFTIFPIVFRTWPRRKHHYSARIHIQIVADTLPIHLDRTTIRNCYFQL